MNQVSKATEIRRTTMTAKRSSLDTLATEARRRGVSLTTVLGEAVDEHAAALRASRRPRLGIARSTDGRSAAEVTANPICPPLNPGQVLRLQP